MTGRGGLPANPNDLLGSEEVLSNWVTLPNESEQDGDRPFTEVSTADVIVAMNMIEVQGWVMDSHAAVHLVAYHPHSTQPQQEQLCPRDRRHDNSL